MIWYVFKCDKCSATMTTNHFVTKEYYESYVKECGCGEKGTLIYSHEYEE